MYKHFLVAGAAVLALSFTANTASAANCAYEHPKKAGKLSSNFVQAMVSCNNPGGNTPNTTTSGGVPACSPPETYNVQAGNPTNGWRWDEAKGQGSVQFKASKNKQTTPAILNPPGTADLAVQMSLAGVLDANGLASGTGTLATVARATLNDPANGDLTVVDFPAGFGFTLTSGKVKLKTTANQLLNGIGQPSLPKCSSIEVVSVLVLDENGNAFANMGTFLP